MIDIRTTTETISSPTRLTPWWISISLHAVLLAAVAVRFVTYELAAMPDDARATKPTVIVVPQASPALHEFGESDETMVVVAARQGGSLADLVHASVARHQQAATDEVFQQLQTMAGKLERMSDVQRVRQIARHIRETVIQDAPPHLYVTLAGSFEFSSARICRVSESESGEFLAELSDRFGNRYDAPLDSVTGRRVQRIFELVQRYPLLRVVYEDIVCDLLDQLAQRQQT